ncbi:DUF6194 family protein [Actinophytocola sp.]|uniref:DUF6194 family protein n=1 Tax=Actinophytocola sp. TaxID=1872138 RepID=UPI00389A1BF1
MTIMTKDYPDDEGARINRPDTFRLNFFAGKDAFVSWTGHEPSEPAVEDAGVSDKVIAHQANGRQGSLAVVHPGHERELRFVSC